jgi:hypothetical protein
MVIPKHIVIDHTLALNAAARTRHRTVQKPEIRQQHVYTAKEIIPPIIKDVNTIAN